MSKSTKWFRIDLPLMSYSETIELQHSLLSLRINDDQQTNYVLFVEHYPVFTLGNRAASSNIHVSEDFLKQRKFAVERTRRGGDVTYHGPGQLLVYPIFSLRQAALRVPEYIELLEEVMIKTVDNYQLNSGRSPLCRGAWVGDKKIGSVGIAVKQGVTYHGAALNGEIDLSPFSWISPCGLDGRKVTSIAQETGELVDMPSLRQAFSENFQSLFKVELIKKE